MGSDQNRVSIGCKSIPSGALPALHEGLQVPPLTEPAHDVTLPLLTAVGADKHGEAGSELVKKTLSRIMLMMIPQTVMAGMIKFEPSRGN